MNDTEYFITIIALTVVIFLFGGKKVNHKIEYDANKFYNLKKIDKFKNKFKKYKETHTFKFKIFDTLIPNIENVTVVYLKPNELFSVNHYCDENYDNKCLMVVYNYDDQKVTDLDLLVSKNSANLNEGLFYKINKNVTITNVYPVYNGTQNTINFAIIIIKKPHWFL